MSLTVKSQPGTAKIFRFSISSSNTPRALYCYSVSYRNLTLWLWLTESEPLCSTNISLPHNAVHESDHIEITCSVTSSGLWTPRFHCGPDLRGTTIYQNSTNDVLYSHVIAASDIENLTVINCYMTFTLTVAWQRAICSQISVQPDYPVYNFPWNSSAIHIVKANG